MRPLSNSSLRPLAALASAGCALIGGRTAAPSSPSTRKVLAEPRDELDGSSAGGWTSQRRRQKSPDSTAALARRPIQLATSPVNKHPPSDPRAWASPDEEEQEPNKVLECDYAILGHGKAGRSAVRTIRRLDPTARIVVIDPSANGHLFDRGDLIPGSGGAILLEGEVQLLASRACRIDHMRKFVHIDSTTVMPISSNVDASPEDFVTAVRYEKAALIATGSRGAPPPEGCMAEEARGRFLELRSTASPPSSSRGMPSESTPLPVLDPPTVRSLSLLAASQGATVAIMGSGHDALELAVSCSRVAPQKEDDYDGNKKVLLLFGNSSPMSNVLPRYLGAAVAKRLRQIGVQVEDRVVVRYISMETSDAGRGGPAPPRLELYAVKSYDHLDSRRLSADLMVLAPAVDGLNGTAAIPAVSSFKGAPNHLPWSSLIQPPILTCYLDDGRIATNSELSAASSIFAAGSAAKYPDIRTGRAEVGGGRHVSAKDTGEIAARNMVLGGMVGSPPLAPGPSSSPPSYLQESIPVWRSDKVAYLPGANDDDFATSRLQPPSSTSALYSMGIHALCVGRCDSEGMATHGFWWTNTNQAGESRSEGKASADGARGDATRSIAPTAFMRRATRRANSSKPAGMKRGSLPVYGSGVVFYLDRFGNVEGIMLWGLPYSSDPNNVDSGMNDEVVERMKEIIRSNGDVAIHDHSGVIHKDANVELGFLSHLHLGEESKHLASMALSGSAKGHGTHSTRRAVVLGRPLYRYMPLKSTGLMNRGKINRRDESGRLADEDDLFHPAASVAPPSDRAEERARPPSLMRVYPLAGGAVLPGTSEYDLEREEGRRRLRAERARPPKEEPLWLRQGEEGRLVNRSDALVDNFLRNMQAGKFSDGRDAVKQAPVPKAYLNWKEGLKESTDGADGMEEEEDAEE